MTELKRSRPSSRAPIRKERATLDRVLSKAGVASRTDSRKWIQNGRVKVNGKVVRDPDHWVERDRDIVHLDGVRLAAENRIYLAFNKPAGVVVSHGDPDGRPTVYDYLKEVGRWLVPVGRLDMDTSGLLLLTNDTDFADSLLRPDSQIPKTYHVKVSGQVTSEEYFALAFGMDIGRGERSDLAAVREVRTNARYTWFELRITEGKNRQVRRMCEMLGHPVLKLVRIRIGGFSLGDLAVGQYRTLGKGELKAIRSRLSGPQDYATKE